jgi:hypothetical protein
MLELGKPGFSLTSFFEKTVFLFAAASFFLLLLLLLLRG